MGGQTLVPFAGPRLGHRLHEASLELADTGVMTHDFCLCLCLCHILREKERSRRRESIPKRSKEKKNEDSRREIWEPIAKLR